MSAAGITTDEMYESMTGFEEIAVEKAFDQPLEGLANGRVSMFGRALVFVHYTRQGDTAPEAKKKALGMRLKDVEEFFDEPEDEPMPEEPITDEGKGDTGVE